MGFGEFESKRKMLGYSFFYILLQYIALTSDMHTAKITLPSNLGSMSSRLSVVQICGMSYVILSFHCAFRACVRNRTQFFHVIPTVGTVGCFCDFLIFSECWCWCVVFFLILSFEVLALFKQNEIIYIFLGYVICRHVFQVSWVPVGTLYIQWIHTPYFCLEKGMYIYVHYIFCIIVFNVEPTHGRSRVVFLLIVFLRHTKSMWKFALCDG